MTIQEAIQELEYAKSSVSWFGNEEVLDMAIAALEKQIIKPIEPSLKNVYRHGNCPVCGRIFWQSSHVSTYCDTCGQRLKGE